MLLVNSEKKTKMKMAEWIFQHFVSFLGYFASFSNAQCLIDWGNIWILRELKIGFREPVAIKFWHCPWRLVLTREEGIVSAVEQV